MSRPALRRLLPLGLPLALAISSVAYAAGTLVISMTTTYTVPAGSTRLLTGAVSTSGTCNSATLTYRWDTDNNGTYDHTGATYTFDATALDGTAAGLTRLIVVEVSDDATVDCAPVDTETLTLTVTNAPPTLTTSAFPASGVEGSALSFTASATDPEGSTRDPLTYTWTFGDGDTAVGASATHAYADQGNFSASLLVSDGDGGTASAAATVTIANADPVIGTTIRPATADEGDALTYACPATDPGADTLTTTWSFSDGSPAQTGTPITQTWTDDGTRQAICTVTDGDGGSDTATLTTTVANVDPQIDSVIIPTTGDEGDTLTFEVSASDVGADDVISVLWDFGDGGTETADNPDHIYENDGTYTLTLTVTDDDGGETVMTETVVIGNLPPTFTSASGSAATVAEGTALTYTCAATDPGSETLAYTWTFTDGSAAKTGASISHTWRDNGSQVATCTVEDDGGETVTGAVNTTVTNVAPTIASSTIPTTGTEGSALSFSVTPADKGAADTFTYAWDFGDSSTSTSQSPSKTYSADGTYSLSLRVSDDDGGSVTSSATVVIRNAAPTASANGSPTGVEGTALTYSCTGSDPGGDTLSYSWAFSDGSSAVGATVSKTWADEGSVTATCTVSDGTDTDTDTVATTISNANPTISASTFPSGGAEGTALSFSAAASDPGADTLTYTWAFGDGDSATGASASHAYADNGSYTARLTVTDGDGGSATTTATVVVTNARPTATASGPATGSEGATLSYSCVASDAGTADTHTYAWAFSDGTSASGSPASKSWSTSGTKTATCTATDDDGGQGTNSVTTVISAVAPSLSTVSIPTSGTEGTAVAFRVVATSADPTETFSYLWSFGDGSTATTAVAAHAYVDEGTYPVTITVTDSDGLTASQSGSVIIANSAPTAAISGPTSGDEGDSLSFTCAATDLGSADTHTYAWDLGDGSTATGASITHAYADNGSYSLRCTTTDNDGASGTLTRSLTLANAAPVLSGSPDPLATDAVTYVFSPTLSDAGSADTFTWALSGLPAAATLDSAGTLTWSPTDADVGTYSVVLTVTDDDGASDSLAWTLEVTFVDTDADGLSDADEVRRGTDPTLADTDGDSLSDFDEVTTTLTDPTQPFSDSDGLNDGLEVGIGLDPNDGDMDDDGLQDDVELSIATVPTDCDSDNDGLPDGLEEGTTTPDVDTDLSTGCYVADGEPSSQTDPTLADTDGDTLSDGDEDADSDGALDASETSPLLRDTDGDSLDDARERALSTNGRDADSDEDGLTDGVEQLSLLTGPLTCDSDGDGLSDGLERGIDSSTAPADTDPADPCFAADAEPTTLTDPADTDSDDDGLLDGDEDTDANGVATGTEPDPTLPDTDGDGVPDGEETDWSLDSDFDGVVNVLDDDADDDGLLDGDEVGPGDPTPVGDDADGTATSELDTDLDGIPDMVDDDDDGDTLTTVDEGTTGDFDGDGTLDYLDPDNDDDGFAADDCGAYDSSIFPGAPETPIDGLDQDCDDGDTCYTDADADRYYVETPVASRDTICGNALGEARVGDIDGDGDVDQGQDRDGDGINDVPLTTDGLSVALPLDCDDSDATIHPYAIDACEDYGTTQIDNDCDGDSNTVTQWEENGTPTDFTDDVLVTSAVTTDEFPFYEDKDYDGFGDESAPPIFPCEPPDALTDAEKEAGVIAYVPSSGDCDDENAFVYPGADELCNGLDEDCDDIADEPEDLGATSGCALSYADHDQDGYGSDLIEDQLCLCFDGEIDPDDGECPDNGQRYEITTDGTCYTDRSGDCYDYDANIHDGAPERLDGDDNDCDGLVAAVELDCDDDGSLPLSSYAVGLGDDEALDRATLGLPTACVEAAEIELQCWGLPIRLTCNGDELWSASRSDDGVVDKFKGGSRIYSAGRLTFTPGDCDDQCAARYPGATEVCDGRDNDCDLGSTVTDTDADGLIDQVETDAARVGQISPEELDLDGDGFVACSSVPSEEQTVLTAASCSSTFVDNGLLGDCNDQCALSHPVAEEERCNGFLDICDGVSEGSDQDQDGFGTCGLGGTAEGSALVEDLFVLVWFTEEEPPEAPPGPERAFPDLSLIDRSGPDTGAAAEEGDLFPLLLPRPEAALCDSALSERMSEELGEEALATAVAALEQGDLGSAVAPLLQRCIEAEQNASINRFAGHCGVVRLSLSQTADEDQLDDDTMEALGLGACVDHPEQRTWRTVWARDRLLLSRRLVQEWECYRSAGTYGCGELQAPAGWAAATGPSPGGAFNYRAPADLLDDPRWWTELGRFSPEAVSVGILYGCWDPVELDERAGQSVGGDCSDGRGTANREEPEGPGDLVALYSGEMADLAACDRCLDGIDNNCDGTLDCQDPTCAACFVGQGAGCADADSPCAAGGCTALPPGPLFPTGFALTGLTLGAVLIRRRRR